MKKKVLIAFYCIFIACGINVTGGQDGSKDESIGVWKSYLNKFKPIINSTQLKYMRSFPIENSIKNDDYLWKPGRFAFDEKYIYVLDIKWNKIYKISFDGNIVGSCGRKGQGPGEFSNPECIYKRNGYIYVNDNSKYDIQVFNEELKYIKTIKTFKVYIDIAVNKDGLIYAVPMRTKKGAKLIDILDKDGKIVKSIVDEKFGGENSWNVNNFIYITINEKNEMYAGFVNYNLVIKIDDEGRIIKKYDIKQKYSIYASELNEKESRKKENRRYYNAIFGLKSINNNLYVLMGGPYLSVVKIDENNDNQKEYWNVISYDYFPADLNVVKNKLYILVRKPEAKIDMFQME